MRSFLLLLLAVLALVLGGCAWHRKPQSSTHIYEGSSPKIKYNDQPESAGGELHSY